MKEPKDKPRTQYLTQDPSKQIQPLPPDPERLNACRAGWAAVVLDEFQRQTGADLDDAVSDLLVDLMHWCDRSGQEFHHELCRALHHYAEETTAYGEMAPEKL